MCGTLYETSEEYNLLFRDMDYEASVYTKIWQKNFAADGKLIPFVPGISGYAWKSRTDN